VLVLLEEYDKKLDETNDEDLKKSLSKVIRVLRSRYFGALIGEIYIPFCFLTFNVEEMPERFTFWLFSRINYINLKNF